MYDDRGSASPAGAPNEAHDGKALGAVAMEQILLITLRIGFGIVSRQPVILSDQLGEQPSTVFSNDVFGRTLIDKRCERRYEGAELCESWITHAILPNKV